MGSSKKQTVGYKYYLGMHMILCHGPIDFISTITVDKRKAWVGNSTGGPVVINSEGLFGGEEREGGVSGIVDVEMGRNDQGRNSYLQARLGSSVPAFRKVVGLVLRQCYLGLNPYLKTWGFRGQRVHVRQDGIPQWYDDKAGIPQSYVAAPTPGTWPWVNRSAGYFVIGASEEFTGIFENFNGWWHGYIDCFRITKGVARYATVRYTVEDVPFGNESTDPHYSNVVSLLRFNGADGSTSFSDDKGNAVVAGGSAKISTARAKFGTSSGYFNGLTDYLQVMVGANENLGGRWTMDAWVWMESKRETSPDTYGRAIFGYGPLNLGYKDTAWFCNGDRWNYCQREGAAPAGNQPYLVQNIGPRATVGRWAFVSVCFDGENYWMHQDGRLLTGTATQHFDLNPAHIIRECLTDPDWGMGYSDSDIDDASFEYAADLLYNEGMGISILWDRQTPIEDFVNEIVKHIAASVYVDRTTGKFVLKLIRDDYTRASLLVLDENHIQKVEGATRPTAGELVNSVTAVYWDAETGENASLTVQDSALVQMQGAVINTTLQYPGFTNQDIASKAALRALTSLSIPLLSCTVYADRTASQLNIGDVFRMSWPDLQVNDLVMRVTAIALGDGRSNVVKLTVIEDVFATPVVSAIVVDPTPPTTDPDPSAPAEPATLRAVLEAPYYEACQQQGQASVDSVLAAGPEASYVLAGSARPTIEQVAVMQTDPGTGFEDVDTLDFSPGALLSGPVDRMTTTLSVGLEVDLDLVQPGGWAVLFGPHGHEFVRVDSVAPPLVEVGRAVLDSVPLEHPAGTLLLFMDDNNGIDPTEYVLGETVDVRLLPVSGSGRVPELAAPVDSVLLAGRAFRPYPPGNFKVEDSYFPSEVTSTEIPVTWAHRDRKQQTGGSLIDFTDGDVGPEAGVTYRLDTYGIDHEGVETLIYSQPGLVGTSATVDLATNAPPSTSVQVSIRLFSVRDGVDSLFPQRCDVDVLSAPFNLSATYEA